MGRSLLLTLMIAVLLAAGPHAQNQFKPDEYSRATGFAVDIKTGSPQDEGWEHFTDAIVKITAYAPGQPEESSSLDDTVAKFRMQDESGQSAGIEIRPCDGISKAVCLVMSGGELPKSLASWLRPTLQPKAIVEARDLLIEIAQKNGKVRGYRLKRAFPRAFTYVDIAADGNSGTVMSWVLEVRVDRVEMA